MRSRKPRSQGSTWWKWRRRLFRRAAVLALGFVASYEANHTLGCALLDDDRTVRTLAENSIRCVWTRAGSEADRPDVQAVSRAQARAFVEAAVPEATAETPAEEESAAAEEAGIKLEDIRAYKGTSVHMIWLREVGDALGLGLVGIDVPPMVGTRGRLGDDGFNGAAEGREQGRGRRFRTRVLARARLAAHGVIPPNGFRPRARCALRWARHRRQSRRHLLLYSS